MPDGIEQRYEGVHLEKSCRIQGIAMLHVVLEHDPAVEDQRVDDEGFLTAQAERVGDPHLDVFACFLRDERRPIQGGLLGRLWWRWLYVERLWVTPALRGQGHGRHQIANEEGARGSQKATFHYNS